MRIPTGKGNQERVIMDSCWRRPAFYVLFGLIVLAESRLASGHDAKVRHVSKGQADRSEGCSTVPPQGFSPDSDDSSLENFCEFLCDGLYSLGCVSQYVACSGGSTNVMECPADLVLDVNTQECQYRQNVSVCMTTTSQSTPVTTTISSEQTTMATESTVVFDAGATSESVPTAASSGISPALAFEGGTTEPGVSSNFSCANLPDGVYQQGCSSVFVACIDGDMAPLHCPDNLRFESVSGQCLPEEQVAACGGTASPPPAAAEPLTLAQGTVESSTPLTVPTSSEEDLTACESLPNGIHSFGCSSEAVACAFGKVLFFIHCPAREKFDISSLSCQREQFVTACGGIGTVATTPVTTITTSEAATTPVAFAEPSPTSEPVAASGASDTLCEGLPDGMYARGCSSQFVACINGVANLLHCPDDEAYDPNSHSCLPKELVSLCRGTASTTAAPFESTTPVVAQAPASTEVPTTNTTSEGVQCEFLADGMYDLGCNTDFIACVAGRAIRMMCPAKLKYDAISDKCLAACDVRACRNVTGIQTTTEAPLSQNVTTVSLANPEESTPPAANAEPFVADFTCNSLPDGPYALGCSSRFLACVNGKAFALRCPSPLKFDAEMQECLEERYVDACAEQLGAASESPSSSQTSMSPPPAAADVTSSSTAVTEGFCRDLSDGPYALGCSTQFVVCISGSGYHIRCPSGLLVFDEETKQCRPRCDVRACGGCPTTTSAPVGAAALTSPVIANNPSAIISTSRPQQTAKALYTSMAIAQGEAAAPPNPTMSTISTSLGTTAAAPSPARAFSCKGKKDGVYVRGCSAVFVTCINGATIFLHCPEGEAFDYVSAHCLQRRFVSTCSGSQTMQHEMRDDEARQPGETVAKTAQKVVIRIPYRVADAAVAGND